MSTKSTTLYLGDARLSIRLPIDLWRQLAKYTIITKEPGNTLMLRLLTQHFGIGDLTEIHSRLLLSKIDPESSKSANTIVVNLLTEYFSSNPV